MQRGVTETKGDFKTDDGDEMGREKQCNDMTAVNQGHSKATLMGKKS